MTLQQKIESMARAAKQASYRTALVTAVEKNRVLKAMSQRLMGQKKYLIAENAKDLSMAKSKGYARALVDRLILDEKRIQSMADSLGGMTRLKDMTGEIIQTYKRPNGLIIKKVRAPIGVVGIIYESRPDVTSDCIGLCLKSGNAVILKGGKEALYSNQAIYKILRSVLKDSVIPEAAVQFIGVTDRQAVNILLKQDRFVDIVVPRGGEGLIKFVAENSSIPVVKHYKGVCHVYVSHKADLEKAYQICLNAKVQRPGVCNAMETLLVHQACSDKFLPDMIAGLREAGVEIRGCPRTRAIVRKGVKAAVRADWEAEYLDLILAVKIVSSLEEGIGHINRYGSHHSDAIVTRDKKEVEKFFISVDSACLYANASTRFTDGYEYGFGAEIGISTDKLHVRGPMALEGLTTYKYVVYGQGQIRQ